VTNHMLSCKLPPKQMARKNLMSGLPGADWLQTQELEAWWATTCKMGDRKRHCVSHGCEKEEPRLCGAQHVPQRWFLPQATICSTFTDLQQKY